MAVMNSDDPSSAVSPHTQPLLTPGEPAAFSIVNEDGRAPVLFACDHASRAVPSGLADLGLDEAILNRHVAWDIGAAELTRMVALKLGAPAIFGGYSRLVIDLNRQPGDPTSIPEISDEIVIPGNQALSEAEAERRLEWLFRPYHNSITQILARLWRTGPAPALISIHSFTPRMASGAPRPWHVGVLWNRDGRMAEPALRLLNRYPDVVVGDNEPYSGRDIAYTIDRHAGAAGLPHISFEVRQDLIENAAGIERWASVLSEVLGLILADPDLHRVEHF